MNHQVSMLDTRKGYRLNFDHSNLGVLIIILVVLCIARFHDRPECTCGLNSLFTQVGMDCFSSPNSSLHDLTEGVPALCQIASSACVETFQRELLGRIQPLQAGSGSSYAATGDPSPKADRLRCTPP